MNRRIKTRIRTAKRIYQTLFWCLMALFALQLSLINAPASEILIHPADASQGFTSAPRLILGSDPKPVVEQILTQHGIDFKEADRIIRCESQYNPRAWNKNRNGTYDVGIWQINDIHGLSWADRVDLVKATEFAVELYKKRSWTPWVCARELNLL